MLIKWTIAYRCCHYFLVIDVTENDNMEATSTLSNRSWFLILLLEHMVAGGVQKERLRGQL